jgi:hypothetical protein
MFSHPSNFTFMSYCTSRSLSGLVPSPAPDINGNPLFLTPAFEATLSLAFA